MGNHPLNLSFLGRPPPQAEARLSHSDEYCGGFSFFPTVMSAVGAFASSKAQGPGISLEILVLLIL